MKVMEDKEGTGDTDDPLKTELVLLSQEIHSTLTPPTDDEDNTTLTNLIKDTSGPTLNGSKDTDTDEDTADASENATAQVFLERVKEILEGSGIELVLPVDCGRVSEFSFAYFVSSSVSCVQDSVLRLVQVEKKS